MHVRGNQDHLHLTTSKVINNKK